MHVVHGTGVVFFYLVCRPTTRFVFYSRAASRLRWPLRPRPASVTVIRAHQLATTPTAVSLDVSSDAHKSAGRVRQRDATRVVNPSRSLFRTSSIVRVQTGIRRTRVRHVSTDLGRRYCACARVRDVWLFVLARERRACNGTYVPGVVHSSGAASGATRCVRTRRIIFRRQKYRVRRCPSR